MKSDKKIVLTEEQLNFIVEELHSGMMVFINLDTMEIKSVLDTNDSLGDTEFWENELDEMEQSGVDYFEVEKPDSRDAYRIMENFAATVEDERLRDKLELGLNLSKPFRNFRDIIDFEDEYRKKWFEYRDARTLEYVKEQIELHNNGIIFKPDEEEED